MRVNIICPGYVRSPMTDVMCKRPPFVWEMQPAVNFIVAALRRDTPLIHFPLPLTVILWALGAVLPMRGKPAVALEVFAGHPGLPRQRHVHEHTVV